MIIIRGYSPRSTDSDETVCGDDTGELGPVELVGFGNTVHLHVFLLVILVLVCADCTVGLQLKAVAHLVSYMGWDNGLLSLGQ